MATNNIPLTQQSASAGPRSKTRVKPARGFSLLELLIALAVLALLTAIAMPAYNNYIRSVRRSDAIDALLQSQQIMENCRTNSASRTYAGCAAQISSLNPKYYTIAASVSSVSGIADMGYSLTATPKAGTSQAKDSKCKSFGINQVGSRSATHDSCWK